MDVVRVAAASHSLLERASVIGGLCADTLVAHEDDFAPFCEYDDETDTFTSYVNAVRSSSQWGGHLELRALSLALNRPIYIYSADTVAGKEPLVIDGRTETVNADEPIRLSYHLHYYALGEHYNMVVPGESSSTNED
jgi:OTU domain-containing protein 6